jgi:LSD1 subclass zinc finger protein
VGISCVTDFAIATMTIPAGLAIMAAAALIAIWAQDVNEAIGYIAIGGFVVMAFGARKFARAWRARPTDIVLEADGLRIDGGQRHGMAFAWNEVGPAKVVDITTNDDLGRVCQLRLDELAIAEADDVDEIASLEEVAEAVRARVEASRGQPRAARASASTLACRRCGAPLAPVAEELAVCPHCQERTAMPPDVRERVRAAALLPAARRRVDRLVAHLLDQPGAQSTTVLLVLSLLFIGGAWPVTIWAYVHAYHAHQLTVARGFELAALPILLVIDGFFLSRVRMVDRRALASFVTVFGASPPAVPGDPPRCRSCSAPLHMTDDATVVRCVFCDVSNITGVDLRSLAGRTQDSQDSLEDALRRRSEQRWKWRLLALASTPLVAATVVVLRDVYALQSVRTSGKLHVEDLRVEGQHPLPSMSGAWVLFRTEKDGWQIYDMKLRKARPVGFRGYAAPAWFGDDRYAVLTRDGSETDITAYDPSSPTGHKVAAVTHLSVDAVLPGGNGELALQVHHDAIFRIPASPRGDVDLRHAEPVAHGELAAFTADGQVFTVTDLAALAHAEGQLDSHFALSPDGKRIVFVSLRRGSDLYVANVDGDGPRPLTIDCGDCADPAWGGDGWVYFVSHGFLHRLKP